MITRYENKDPFDAQEEYLFVPIAREVGHRPTDGFAKAVLARFPLAEIKLSERAQSGVDFEGGELLVVGDHEPWYPKYALALAAVHDADNGWHDTPDYIERALSELPKRRLGRQARVAMSGLPGTGLSGLKGGAEPVAIRRVIEASDREVVIYTRNASGDRALAGVRPYLPDGEYAQPLA